MKVLGITGGVGAGKSTVLAYLEKRYDAKVIECDEVGRLVQQPGGSCYDAVRKLLGEEVFDEDGSLNRQRAAQRLFADADLLVKMNGIIHPAVKQYVVKTIEQERESGSRALVVIEAALLLEDHYDLLCDEIWYLYTREEVRRERLKRSRGYSDEKITNIMQKQRMEKEFRDSCQFVVDNSSDIVENTYEQIDRGLKEHGLL